MARRCILLKEVSYKTLVHPELEYAASVSKTKIQQVEQVKRMVVCSVVSGSFSRGSFRPVLFWSDFSWGRFGLFQRVVSV